MTENWKHPRQNEEVAEYLFRVGQAKDNKEISETWEELSDLLNSNFGNGAKYGESFWRKWYKRLSRNVTPVEGITESPITEAVSGSLDAIRRATILLRDERHAEGRRLRDSVREHSKFEILAEKIQAIEPQPKPFQTETRNLDKEIIVMLSDVHYGISFRSALGSYDAKIAALRIANYTHSILEAQKLYNISKCTVLLMGDMVSGNIHQTIRIENRESLMDQLVGVSELTAQFLRALADRFEGVSVYSVAGNHSRVERDPDNALRSERLDDLIPWYCKARLSSYRNLSFQVKPIEKTFINFKRFGKTYVAAHGDMDSDKKVSAFRIGEILGEKVDYFLCGHTHVVDVRMENTGYINNGCVCGSGDEYTVKKRLYGVPMQTFLVVSELGVESIHPVRLDIRTGGESCA